MFAGLKGAVPILLGSFVVAEGVTDSGRLYGIVIIVVILSVVVQGSLVPSVAGRLRVPMRVVEPEPWTLGVRLRDEPDGVQRLTVGSGSPADGRRIDELDAMPENTWVSFVVRRGQLVRVSRDTVLEEGDEALVLGEQRTQRGCVRSSRDPASRFLRIAGVWENHAWWRGVLLRGDVVITVGPSPDPASPVGVRQRTSAEKTSGS